MHNAQKRFKASFGCKYLSVKHLGDALRRFSLCTLCKFAHLNARSALRRNDAGKVGRGGAPWPLSMALPIKSADTTICCDSFTGSPPQVVTANHLMGKARCQ